MTDTVINYCYVHPTREATLRCKRCERYICTQCAVRTPTGYMCNECVRLHQKTFDTAFWYDYVLGFFTTFVLSFIASAIAAVAAAFIGFYLLFLGVALGGGAGVTIANLTLRVIHRRRSRPLFLTCAAGIVAGAIPIVLFMLRSGSPFALIGLIIYVAIAVPTVYRRIAGIQL